MEALHQLDTEQRNPASAGIDRMSTLEMVTLINTEDHHCAEAVARVLPEIARSVDLIEGQLRKGVEPEMVTGLIAGGPSAFLKAVEGAEDSRELGRQDLIDHGFSEKDALVGIAASGRTPYVIGAMDYARETGAPVMALTCCRDSVMSRHADVTMAPIPGPEVITGSSRMKSGTCQKLVLNMLSTCVMVKLGKVYGNLMVDVQATNEKLVDRSIRIVRTATGADEQTARAALEESGFRCKTAIVMILLGMKAPEAVQALEAAHGRIAEALEQRKA